MMRRPGDELTPSVAGRGDLRASHADRDHVADVLKAAFVQGRLTKEELEARAGRVYAARTYDELAELTADLPGGSIAAPPRPAARTRARRLPTGKIALVGAGVLTPPAILAAAILTGNDALGKVFLLIFPWYFMGWLVAVLQIMDNSRQRSRGQLPPRPAEPGWAFDDEQDRGDRSRRCPARRMPADLRGAG